MCRFEEQPGSVVSRVESLDIPPKAPAASPNSVVSHVDSLDSPPKAPAASPVRLLKPVRRHPVSQRLAHDDITLAWSGWQPHAFHSMSYERAFTVSGIPFDSSTWEDRSADEQELLTAMGRRGRPVPKQFSVWRVSWRGRGHGTEEVSEGVDSRLAPYTQVPRCNMPTTCAAFVKLESGEVGGAWAEGAQLGEWALCGTLLWQTSSQYVHVHPQARSAAGSMLVALPAYVFGTVDLREPRNWWFFPPASDQ